MVLVEKGQQRAQSTLLQDIVSALRAVSCNVAQSPDRLLSHIEYWRREQFDEDGNGACVDDDLSMVRCARGDIC